MQEVPWERSRKRLVLRHVLGCHMSRTASLRDSRTEKLFAMDIFIIWYCLNLIWYEFILLWFLTTALLVSQAILLIRTLIIRQLIIYY